MVQNTRGPLGASRGVSPLPSSNTTDLLHSSFWPKSIYISPYFRELPWFFYVLQSFIILKHELPRSCKYIFAWDAWVWNYTYVGVFLCLCVTFLLSSSVVLVWRIRLDDHMVWLLLCIPACCSDQLIIVFHLVISVCLDTIFFASEW
jgi:hypothetical protein